MLGSITVVLAVAAWTGMRDAPVREARHAVAETLYRAGRALQAVDRDRVAAPFLAGALAVDAGHLAARVAAVHGALDAGEIARADAWLAPWLGTAPTDAGPDIASSVGRLYALGGRTRFAQSRATPAEAFYDLAIELARARDDRALEATARIGRARVRYHLCGRIEPAREDLEVALSLARGVRAVGLEARALRHQGVVTWWFEGRASAALEHYFRPALALFRGAGDARGEAITRGSIGLAYQSIGDSVRALEAFREALAIQREIGDRAGTADTLRHLAGLYRDTGDMAVATRVLDEALGLARAIGYRLAENGIEVDRARHELADRDPDAAFAVLERVLAREDDAPLLASYRLRTMADLSRGAGRPRRAERLRKRALRVEPENSRVETRDVVSQLLTEAEIARDLGNWARADDLVRRAREILAEGTEWRRWHWGTHLVAAEVAAHRGRPTEGMAILTGTADEEAAWLTEAPSRQGPSARPAHYDRLYRLLLSRASPLRADDVLAARADVLAFRFLEHARRSAFRAAAATPGSGRRSAPTAATAASLESLEQSVEQLRARPEDEAWDAVRRGYDAYQRSVVDATLIPSAARPPMIDSPLAPEAIQARLDPRTGIVAYLFAGEAPFAVALTSSRIVSVALPTDRAGLRAKVRLLDALLDPSARRSDATAWAPVAADLWRVLIAPLDARGLLDGIDRLAILPADALSRLPFAALIDRDGPGRRFLVESRALFFPPSAGSLVSPKADGPSTARRNALAVGFGAAIDGLPALRHARDEARVAAVALDGELLLDDAASESAIKARADSLRSLHIASHATPAPELPLLSALKLAPSGRDDGNLTIAEILELDLDAELVVLASCRGAASAAPGADRPDERRRFSLVDAFLRAGSDAVVASLSEVDDAAAFVFMRTFYRHLADSDAVTALAAAQRQMLAGQNAHEHPGHWAPFVVVGR